MASYIPPSVIVNGEAIPGASNQYVIPSTICIIGKIDQYPSKTVRRVLENGATAVIDVKNLIADSVKLTDASGTVLVKDTDYTQAVDADASTLSITITKEGMKTQAVNISFEWLPDAFFDPLKYFTKNSVSEYYGEPWNDDHSVKSPISAAAEFAFDNGAASLCIIPVFDDGKNDKNPKQNLNMALEKMKLEDDIAIICPIGFDADALTQVKDHIDWCNANKLERRGIFALDGTVKSYSIDDLVKIERSFDDDCVMFIPNTIAYVYVSDSRSAVELPGWLYSAAVSGLAISLPFNQSLTRHQVTGFFNVQPYLYEEKNVLAQAGGCVLERMNGGIVIRQSLVTTQKRLLDWSYSGVFQYVVRAMRDLFDPYIGKPSDDSTVMAIDALCTQELSAMVERGYIANYSDLEVSRRAGDPSTIDVKFRYAWLQPINWIRVSFNVDMTY